MPKLNKILCCKQTVTITIYIYTVSIQSLVGSVLSSVYLSNPACVATVLFH